MSNKRFTEDEIIGLNANKNVVKATEKYIEYTNGFKEEALEGRRSVGNAQGNFHRGRIRLRYDRIRKNQACRNQLEGLREA